MRNPEKVVIAALTLLVGAAILLSTHEKDVDRFFEIAKKNIKEDSQTDGKKLERKELQNTNGQQKISASKKGIIRRLAKSISVLAKRFWTWFY
jgi:hypothetical protein